MRAWTCTGSSNDALSATIPHHMNQSDVVARPDAYLARRGLTRQAGRRSLWALAVSAVIVGEFSGWNQGLVEGGFGGLLVATLIIAVMYLCLCCSIAELGTAMPFTGGAYAYARAAFGVWGGFLAGGAQAVEYVLSIASIVVTIGIQVNVALLAAWHVSLPAPIVWLIVSAVFVFLNVYDTKVFFRSAFLFALASLLVLIAFWTAAIPQFEVANLLEIAADPKGTPWLPHHLVGIAWAAPFAIWFFLAVEQVPLAAEESLRPERDIPAGMLWALATLVVAAMLTLFLNAGISPGAAQIGADPDPLLRGFETAFGSVLVPGLLVLLTLVGSLSSFHSILFAAGRSIYGLARAGYLPTALSLTGDRGTPVAAIAAAASASFVLALAVAYAPREVPVAAILINMAVFGALVSYAFQFLSFLKLRIRHPDLLRPYSSPLGATGAVTGLTIAVATAILLFSNRGYRLALVVCVLATCATAAVFALTGRRNLRPAPEEQFAGNLDARRTAEERIS